MNQIKFVRYLVSETIEMREIAQRLAQKWQFEWRERGSQDLPADELILRLDEAGLALVDTATGAPGPVRIAWATGADRQPVGIKHEMVARAVGVKSGVRPIVWDMTAGLGRDAFVLAALGCHVTLFERSKVLCALLDEAMARLACSSANNAKTAARMTLCAGDSIKILKEGRHVEEKPTVLYLDPMYPHRNKHAAVKKEMRLVRRVVGDDQDGAELMSLALLQAEKWNVRRIAVKRPSHAAYLGGVVPSLEYKGNHTRFDVYLLNGIKSKK